MLPLPEQEESLYALAMQKLFRIIQLTKDL